MGPPLASTPRLPTSWQGAGGAPTSSEGSSLLGETPPPYFRVRLINIDQVKVEPGHLDTTASAFTNEPLTQVPVLRVFGATPAGQRVCLHIHGAFPYCYIEYRGRLEPEVVLPYISRLGQELNAAVAASLGNNPLKEKRQYINAIHLVKGVPFYGYHVGWRYFLKISFTDPQLNLRLQTILESGRVMRTRFQPYENHIRHQLQFMLDYNLFGCDYIDLDEVHFRLPIPGEPHIVCRPDCMLISLDLVLYSRRPALVAGELRWGSNAQAVDRSEHSRASDPGRVHRTQLALRARG